MLLAPRAPSVQSRERPAIDPWSDPRQCSVSNRGGTLMAPPPGLISRADRGPQSARSVWVCVVPPGPRTDATGGETW